MITVKVISDGAFWYDGGMAFANVPRLIWQQTTYPDRSNRVRLGLNCLLIKHPSGNFLIDTGMGTTDKDINSEVFEHHTSHLNKQLNRAGLSRMDIDAVLITHWDRAHAGGLVRLDHEGETQLTFPNASIYAPADAKTGGSPALPAMSLTPHPRLAKELRSYMGNEDWELAPHVSVQSILGGCHATATVRVNTGSERYYYLSDLVPTPEHRRPTWLSAGDQHADETMKAKEHALAWIVGSGAIAVFSHAADNPAGYIIQKGIRYEFRPRPV